MKIRSMLLGLVCLLSASSAQAVIDYVVTTQVTGGRPLSAVQQNDLITINIRLSNPNAANFIAGVGSAIMGYNSSIVEFQSGVAADTSLFCTNTGCTNGVPVTGNDPVTGDPIPLVEGNSPTSGKFVSFVSAIATTARNGNGARDPGFDGIVNGGDTEFRLVFKVLATSGTTTLNIGTSLDSFIGNVIVVSTAPTGGTIDPAAQANNVALTITVPEASSIAAGLGALASAFGLASLRRRIAG